MREIRRVPYTDPWSTSFEVRRQALLDGSPRVAYYYTEPDTSTFRYRAFNMVEALGCTEPTVGAAWLTAADGAGAIDLVADVDVLVVCRALYAPHVAAVIARAKALGKRVLFDVDDLIFDDRYTHLIMETLDQQTDEAGLQFWFGRLARCGATLRLCDGAITTNELLAERIRDFADIPTWVIPNFVNRAQLEIAAEIREEKRAAGPGTQAWIRLGYFSGTPSHNRDFAIVEPALHRLFAEDPRLELVVVGFPPESGRRLARYADRVHTIPLQDFVNLQLVIGAVEINLVPLQDNAFTNCKSELKYFEAAIVDTVTVATPTHTFSRVLRHGDNGFLSRAQEWYEVLLETLERVEDLPRIAGVAAADALARYSPEAQGDALRAALLR